jgi:hypothetical protein
MEWGGVVCALAGTVNERGDSCEKSDGTIGRAI